MIISIFKKNIHDIELNDINDLILQKVRESTILEYKEADFLNPNRADLQKQYWKLIKRICGFANNNGGILILGMKEDSNSCASSITPLHQDHTILINKLRGLTVSHTIPSISLNIQKINTNINVPANYILIIKIVESPEPVMYINSSDVDSNKYFFRYNEDTVPADHATIRLLFSKKNIKDKLIEYLEGRNYGLNYRSSENVVSWISIPFQFPLETFTEINNSTITELKAFFDNPSRDNRFHGISNNGRYSHKGILFFFLFSGHENYLYNGYFEIKKNGYIEFKTNVPTNELSLMESAIISDFDTFINYLYKFYSHYDYFGDIYIILSLKKAREEFKLYITDFSGAIIQYTDNNFSLENQIHIKRVIAIKDLESEDSRLQISEEFKTDLYHCFGID